MSQTRAEIGVISGLANPTRFIALANRVVPWLGLLALVAIAVGLWMGFAAPEERQQGVTVRIMYIHVPFAWISMFCYGLMACAALGTLVWRHPLADVAAKSAAPLGAVFTILALFTGSLWGRPTWGTFWEWDGRMTSTLVLLFIYLGIIALWRAFDDQLRAARIVAVVTLVGALNIPVIKFSVDWWNTLHQRSTNLASSMDPAIRLPLLLMVLGFTLLFLVLHIVSMRTEILNRRAQSLARQAAMGAR